MNSVHDMGGMEGLGALVPDPPGGPFHAPWEARVHALVLATPVGANIDARRRQRERIPGQAYLAMSYYERWLTALEAMLLDCGAVTLTELETGTPDPACPRSQPFLTADGVPAHLSRRRTYHRACARAPLYAAGDAVRARLMNPSGHTRTPRYVRGRAGVVVRDHGFHVFPDVNAETAVETPERLYTVRFRAADLWGPEASVRDAVFVDLFEPYLEGL